MQPDPESTKMTDTEWWDGFDRELGQLLVGVTPAHLVLPIVLAASALTVAFALAR